jgi:hypothetical protein
MRMKTGFLEKRKNLEVTMLNTEYSALPEGTTKTVKTKIEKNTKKSHHRRK